MLHLFVVNPAAGQHDATSGIEAALKALAHIQSQVYRTTGKGDATRFVHDYLSHNTVPVRIYACGGDGTLNEVVNGAVGFPHASIGCYACGSGNDFVKYYGGAEKFLDIKSLVEGVPTPIDLIEVNDRYAINACHFGFDSAVASKIEQFKRFPFMTGKRVYLAGVIWALLHAMRSQCTISCDSKLFHAGDFLLCTMANGTHVGGSYRCAPRSLNDDGLLEVCLADPVSHLRFVRLMGFYQRGEHLDNPDFSSFVHYCRAGQIHITAPEGFIVSLDGELLSGTNFDIRVLHHAAQFIVPANACSVPAANGVA